MKKVRMSLTAVVIAISACSSDENNINTPHVVEAGERQIIDERSMVVLQGNASDDMNRFRQKPRNVALVEAKYVVRKFRDEE